MSAAQQIEGRTALVTGASRGIGRELVTALLERGARRIYAAVRKPEAVADLAATSGGVVVPLRLDVTDAAQVRDAAGQAEDVDLLINNAAVLGHLFGAFDDPRWVEVAHEEFETNVVGPLRVSQAFAPILARHGGGTIVNVGSSAGLVGMPMVLTYSTTKAALHSLTQSTREALQAQGTRVVGVYPGPVDTDMAAGLTAPKTSAASVAHAILDGLEQGLEEIYPDPFARDYGQVYAVNPKALEGRLAVLNAALD
jgi:NAD(P)-dependent dehydrogenase (short-subunit alcohol dehydrogenase family)